MVKIEKSHDDINYPESKLESKPVEKENKSGVLSRLGSKIISGFESMGSLASKSFRAIVSLPGTIKRAIFSSDDKVNQIAEKKKIIPKNQDPISYPVGKKLVDKDEILQEDISPYFTESDDDIFQEDISPFLPDSEDKIIKKDFASKPAEEHMFDPAKQSTDQAARNGDVDAMFELAERLNDETVVINKPNGEIEFKYDPRLLQSYKQAAEGGHVGAMYKLGSLYFQVEQFKNQKLGLEWLEKAAENGDVQALMDLGLYYSGEDEFTDMEKAFDRYSKAAEVGNEEAMYRIGYMYSKGTGVEKNIDLAKEWLKKAENAGFLGADLALRELSKEGEKLNKLGTESKPPANKLDVLEQAAQNGDVDAMFKLAKLLEKGTIAEKIDLNKPYEDVKLIFDQPRVFQLYKQAAEGGHVGAMYNLGSLYYQVEQFKDQKLGLEWLEKASEKGHVQSMMDLGLYYSGNDEWMDMEKAFIQYKRAAEAGNDEGMYMVGHMYSKGKGVEKNIDLAKEWLTKAQNEGFLGAGLALRELSK